MLDTALKIFSEQALGSRPALDHPIAQIKYGAVGVTVMAVAVCASLLVGGAALYVALANTGLSLAGALAVVAVVLLVTGWSVWGICSQLSAREARRQKARTSAQEDEGSQTGPSASDPMSLLSQTALSIGLELAKAFAEGLQTPQEPQERSKQTPHEKAYAKGQTNAQAGARADTQSDTQADTQADIQAHKGEGISAEGMTEDPFRPMLTTAPCQLHVVYDDIHCKCAERQRRS